MAISRIKTEPTGVSIAGTLRAEVEDFLTRFADAQRSGDGDCLASLWETPALVIGRDGVIDIASPRQVAQWFAAARRDATRPDLIDLERIDDRLAVATVRWPRDGGAEAADYTLRRDDRGELKLRCVLMRGVEAPRT